MNIEQALSHAKFYIYQDQKELAREVLVAILREDPNNVEAWILSAQVSDKLEQVLYCLRRASSINPNALESHPNAPQIRAIIDKLQQPKPTLPLSLPSESVSEAETEAGLDEPLAPIKSSLPELVDEEISANSEPHEEELHMPIEQAIPGAEIKADVDQPLTPVESSLPELVDEAISTDSGLHEGEPHLPAEQAISVDEKKTSSVLITSNSDASQPASSFVDQNWKSSTPVLKRKKRWPWVLGLIVLALLVTVLIFAVKLAADFLPQLLPQYFQ